MDTGKSTARIESMPENDEPFDFTPIIPDLQELDDAEDLDEPEGRLDIADMYDEDEHYEDDEEN